MMTNYQNLTKMTNIDRDVYRWKGHMISIDNNQTRQVVSIQKR